MAVAGRVAIVPKGDYVTNEAYKRLDCVMYNGAMYIAKKSVPIGTLPTDKNYWMKSISANSAGGLSKKIVEELPTTDIDESTIYLIRKITPGENDVYNEYMYIEGKWELIGNTAVDLSDYYTQEQINTKISAINTELGKKLTSTSDISDTVVKTLDATPSTRALPKAGDKIKTIVAKTIKYFNDLKTIAFTGNASDLQDLDTFLSTSLLATEQGKRALDEAVGKVLNDKIEEIKNLQGSTDISAIGDGSVTGALSTLNSNLSNKLLPQLIYSYRFSETITNNMTEIKTINGDFSSIFSHKVIIIRPIFNDNKKVDLFNIIHFIKPNTTTIYTGVYAPLIYANNREYYQKIGFQMDQSAIKVWASGTYVSWVFKGLDIYALD